MEILSPPPQGRIKHALFDFDGTISLLREGWQGVMAPMMRDMITGGGATNPELESAIEEFIDDTTGIQTIVQMEGLVDMVRRHGLVPESAILDPAGYKRIYNDRLMERVSQRIEAVERGELTIAQATVRGSIAFVEWLSNQGVRLYIFSGTDRDDVIREAELLGVAGYFDEIGGSIGSYADYNKERVIKELMAKHSLQGPDVLVVGDGPVEIRHGRDYGCFTVGVASNEITGQGWDDAKRARLAKAGAHVLVPDFEDTHELTNAIR